MTKLEERFIQLLADPSFKFKECLEFAENLKIKGVESYMEQAEKLRQRPTSMPIIKTDKHISKHKRLQKKEGTKLGRETVVQQISRLLRTEAQLTVEEAITALITFLRTKRPSSKRSFDWQVDRIINTVGAPKVLHAAYRIRNEKVHYVSKNDWPLEQ